MMILQGNGQTHTTATFFVITTCPEWCKNLGSRIEFFVVTTIPAPCFRTHILDLILELCKVIVFPLYLYLCVCVCNQDLPGSKQRRPDSPIDPQTLHSPALSTSALPAHPHHPTFVCISPIFALLVYLTSGALLTQFAQYFPPSLDFALLFVVYFYPQSITLLLHYYQT